MKRDDKLFSIGEIAKALGVTRRIILHYEERGLIEPDKRDDRHHSTATIPLIPLPSCGAFAVCKIWD